MISTSSLTKYYGKTRGVDGLGLKVEQAEIFGLLGPNGAGKTTTIRLLMGLIKPTKGSAKIDKFDCWAQSVEVKRICGYIPGDVRLYQKYTGSQLIKLYREVRGGAKLADELTQRLDYDPSKKVKSLSKGNRQKLAVILALMHKPDVLILDEPTSGLDPLMQQEFYKILKEFKEDGSTVLVSSHFLPEIEHICDRVAIVKEGKLIVIEDVGELGGKHVKHLEVTFEKKPNIKNYQLPQVTDIKELINNTYKMKVKGDINPVLQALCKDKVKDLSFEHASLEEIFLEYYQ
ncbi:MAG: ABC transporter ATP-binding protein [Actinobacteria bacterium]|nr:MAG: ABC transporter ATP-binding protein [Actinomycetota bacterium]